MLKRIFCRLWLKVAIGSSGQRRMDVCNKGGKLSEDRRAKEKVRNYHLAYLFTFQSIVLTKAKHLYSRYYHLPLTHSIFRTDKQILTVPLSFPKNSNRISSYNSPAFNVNLAENHGDRKKNQHGKRTKPTGATSL
jgi:hypothetical protein